jgi:hypothetical protein
MPASLGVGGSSGLRTEVAVFWGVRRNHKASSSGFHGSGLGWLGTGDEEQAAARPSAARPCHRCVVMTCGRERVAITTQQTRSAPGRLQDARPGEVRLPGARRIG